MHEEEALFNAIERDREELELMTPRAPAERVEAERERTRELAERGELVVGGRFGTEQLEHTEDLASMNERERDGRNAAERAAACRSSS
ncbi:MAG: hypothetical protein U0271_33575 [Polyangiaceae bacterium]